MTKFATLLGRKPTLVVEPPRQGPAAPDPVALELDQELFFPIASQLGEENEVVRNLLIDAEHKIGELEIIKRSIGRLVDPVSKTLRAFEETKNEKLSLQSVLNNTRIAYSKLREDLTTAEKKVATLGTECIRLREVLTVTQQTIAALETTRNEQSAELTTRRAQITDLQRLVQQQATDLQTTRDENQRCHERTAAADRRAARLEADTAAAEQKFLLADQERIAVQALLDKALNDAALMSRRLLDTDKALTATQARLQKVETGFAEAQSERLRLAAALEDATELNRKETIASHARFEALQARSSQSERLLEESRHALAARADEVSAFARRSAEATLARDAIEAKLGQIEGALAQQDTQIKEVEEARATLAERNAELVRAVTTRESAYNRAQEKIQTQGELIEMLEGELKAIRETDAMQIEDLKARLQREQLDRSMAEGALEAGRKDIARLLRELTSLQVHPGASQETAPAADRIQNAA